MHVLENCLNRLFYLMCFVMAFSIDCGLFSSVLCQRNYVVCIEANECQIIQ
jgi:hypothetical protein